MTNIDTIYAEAKEKYELAQKKLRLVPTYDEIDTIFFITDSFKHERFVSEKIVFSISRRIVDTYQSWNGYIHRLLVPNPGYLPETQESQTLDDAKRKVLQEMLKKIMALTSLNGLSILELKDPAEVINEGVRFWNEEFTHKMKPIVTDIVQMWNKPSDEPNRTKPRYNGVS